MSSPTVSNPLGSQPATSDFLFIVLPGLIWGASFLFIAEGLEAVGPLGVTFTRLLVSFLTLACFPAARRALVPLDGTTDPKPAKAWLGVALLGVLWMAFPLSMFPFAEQRISSALAGMLNGLVPLFAVTVAAFLARKAPSRGVVAGLAVGIFGGVLMALPSLDRGRSDTEGVLMIVAAVASYGVSLNLARPLQMRYGALPVLWRAVGVALAVLTPLGIGQFLDAQWTPRALLSLLALGAGGTAIAPVLTAIAAGRLGATRASTTTFLMPPVALLLGILVRDESVAWLSIAGGLACIAGAWLIRRAQLATAAAAAAAAMVPMVPTAPAAPAALSAEAPRS